MNPRVETNRIERQNVCPFEVTPCCVVFMAYGGVGRGSQFLFDMGTKARIRTFHALSMVDGPQRRLNEAVEINAVNRLASSLLPRRTPSSAARKG